jgi:hypothetical protein
VLTFTNRFKIEAEMAIDQIRVWLSHCEAKEYQLKGRYIQYHEPTSTVHRLMYVREDRGKIYLLGEPLLYPSGLWGALDREEYDYEIQEISYENLAYIADEISTI